MIRRLFSHTILYALGPQVPKIAGVFILPILTNYLTSEDYGIYGIVMAYIGAFAGIRDLGLSQVLVNSYYKNASISHRWRSIWSRILGWLTVWSIPYALLLTVVLAWALRHLESTELVYILVLTVLPSAFLELTPIFGSRYFQMAEKPLPVAISSAINGLIVLVVNYICIVWYELHYLGFFISYFWGSLFQFIFYFYPVHIRNRFVPVFGFKSRTLKGHFKVSLPVIPHFYSAYLLNASDRVILDILKVPHASIGLYNFSYTIGNYVEVLGNAVGMAISPLYLTIFKNKALAFQTKSLTFFLQSFFIILCFLLSIWSKEFFALISSNKELALAYPFAIFIVMGYSYRPLYWVAVNRLGFEEQTSALWKISFVSGIMNVVLNLIFVPFWGVMASVAATYLSLLYLGFSGLFLKEFQRYDATDYKPVLWFFTIIFSTVLAFWLVDQHWVLKSIITSFSLLLLFAAFLVWGNKIKITKNNEA